MPRRSTPARARSCSSDGRRLGYDRLLLATGAEPRRIDVPGAELDGIHYLRTLADSEAIGAAIERGRAPRRRRLGLDRSRDRRVGAGEGLRGDDDRDGLAAARAGARAATSGSSTSTSIATTGSSSCPRRRSSASRARAPSSGSCTRDGAVIEAAGGRRRGRRRPRGPRWPRRPASAPRTACSPTSGWRPASPASSSPATSPTPSHPFYGRRLRVEHWANALAQGPAAARSMLGHDVAYDEIPYFFSDQYDVGMEYGGFASSSDEVVIRGDVAEREFIAFWLVGRAGRRRDERERLGRQRRDPRADPLARAGRRDPAGGPGHRDPRPRRRGHPIVDGGRERRPPPSAGARRAWPEQLATLPVDLAAAEAGGGDLLTALGADLESDHLRETPRRVADAYAELLTPVPFNGDDVPERRRVRRARAGPRHPVPVAVRPPPAAVLRHRRTSPTCRASGSSGSRSSVASSTCSRATYRSRSGSPLRSPPGSRRTWRPAASA